MLPQLPHDAHRNMQYGRPSLPSIGELFPHLPPLPPLQPVHDWKNSYPRSHATAPAMAHHHTHGYPPAPPQHGYSPSPPRAHAGLYPAPMDTRSPRTVPMHLSPRASASALSAPYPSPAGVRQHRASLSGDLCSAGMPIYRATAHPIDDRDRYSSSSSYDASRSPGRPLSNLPSSPPAQQQQQPTRHRRRKSQRDEIEQPSEDEGADDQERRHVCPHCDKRFNRPSSLRTHLHTHTGSKPFQCTYPGCGRLFNVNSNMRRHYRTHEQPAGRRRGGTGVTHPGAGVQLAEGDGSSGEDAGESADEMDMDVLPPPPSSASRPRAHTTGLARGVTGGMGALG